MDTGWLALALHGVVGHRPEVWGGAVPQERTPAEVRAEAGTEETRQFVRRVRRVTRRKFTPEEKVRVVLEGFRGEVRVSELCRWEGIRPNVYYAWLKDFMEAGKTRLQADTVRCAMSSSA